MTEALTTAPDLGGKPRLPKRDGVRRSIFPATWLDRALVLEYVDASSNGVSTSVMMPDYCGLGPVASIGAGAPLYLGTRSG